MSVVSFALAVVFIITTALCTHQNKETVLQQKLLRYAMEYLSHLNSDY